MLTAFGINKIPEGIGLNLMPYSITPMYLQYVNDLNLDYVRTGIPWGCVEKSPGVYDWNEYDKLISTLKTYNIKPMIVIGFNNSIYGASNVFTGISTSLQREAFTRFAEKLLARYKNQDIVWEIWNEPNIGEFWKPSPNSKDYALMAKYMLNILRKNFPSEIIIAPALAMPNRGEFISVCQKYGVFNMTDGVSMHFYKSDGNTVVMPEWINIPEISSYITKNIESNRFDNKKIPLIASELGYSTSWQGITDDIQGIYLQRELIINRANQIPISIIHTLMDLSNNRSDDESNFGLIKSNFSPKSSYFMIKELAGELRGAKFVKTYPTENSNDHVYEFQKDYKKLIFAWTTDKSHTIKIYEINVNLSQSVKAIIW